MDSENYLIDDYLDRELSGVTHQQLVAWLHEHDDHVRELAIGTLIHSLLHDFISQRQVQADALLRAMTMQPADSPAQEASLGNGHLSTRAAGRHSVTRPCEAPMRSPNVSVNLRRRRRMRLAAVSIVLTMLAGAITFFALRPGVVAMLTQTAGCRWEAAGRKIADGALIREGDELKLVEGRALVTFVSGAKIILEGPTALTIVSESSVVMTAGAITAVVPVQAVGFKVGLPIAELVDLGTEFTVRMRSNGSFELQVFDGLVELTLKGLNDAVDDAPLRLSEGVAVKYDPTSRKVDAIDYKPEEQIRMP